VTRRFTVSALALALGLAGACKEKGNTTPPVDPVAAQEAKAKADKDAARKQRVDAAAKKRAELAALPALPGVEAPKAVKFPKAEFAKLDNGLELIVLEDHEAPLVEIALVIKAGDIYAPPEASMLASLTASLLAEGTTRHKKAELDALVDATGGTLNSRTIDELAVIGADVLARDADFALRTIAEEVTAPLFPQESFKKLQDQIIQGIASQKSSPFGLALRMGKRVVYGEKSAYGRPFASDAEVRAITRDQVVEFHRRHYGPQNAMLVVAGDVTLAKAKALAQKHLGKWKGGEPVAATKAERPSAPDKTIVHIIDREGSAQATIAVVVPAPRIGEAGWLDGKVLQGLLGGGLSGRLNQVLREQLGLTYGVGAFQSYGYDGGMFFAGGGTKNSSAAEFTDALLDLLMEPGKDGIDAAEVKRIQSKLSGQFALEVEGVGVMVDKTITQRLYGLPADFWERYRVDIEGGTPEQLKAGAAALWNRGAVHVVAIGRADKLGEALGRFGEVRVYDNSLKRLK
jgi:zinc protease